MPTAKRRASITSPPVVATLARRVDQEQSEPSGAHQKRVSGSRRVAHLNGVGCASWWLGMGECKIHSLRYLKRTRRSARLVAQWESCPAQITVDGPGGEKRSEE